MLEFNEIRKSFGNNEVLKSVSLNVEKGNVVTILGPSGSGKTTLLRCANFLETPTSGSISLDGITVDAQHHTRKQLKTLREKCTMVFQNYNLFKNKNAIENVMEGLLVVKKIKKREAFEIAQELLNKVGLSNRLNFYPSQLSGGQQQRVSIARALAMSPSVILLDEPTAALDPELVGDVLNVIKQMAAEGMTMVIVTHEMQFAREVADKIVFMADGHVVEEGSPNEVFKHSKYERTRKFLKRISA